MKDYAYRVDQEGASCILESHLKKKNEMEL